MIDFRLLALMLSLVLVTGLVTPAFAQVDPDAGFSDTAEPGPAKAAGAVPTDGTWFEFAILSEFDVRGCSPADPAGPACFASTGTPTVFADAPPWTFTCGASGCWLTVTDAFDQDDQFEVFDNAASIGTTSNPDFSGQCAPNDSDPEDCLADPDSSSGMFVLGPGDHSISITGVTETGNFGAAYFKVEQHDDTVGGEFLPIDSTALLIAGMSGNLSLIVPIAAGIAGAGAIIIHSRMNKD